MSAAEPTCTAADLELTITRFSGVKDTTPVANTGAWPELVALLQHHDERATKDGPGWAPATYREGATRSNAGVEALTALVLDIDHGTPHWGLFGGLEHVAYTTFRHSDDDPRWRVVVPFSQPCPVDGWEEVWLRATHALAPEVDGSCKDPGRFFYLPSCRPGAERLTRRGPGVLLDWRTLPPVPGNHRSQPPPREHATNGTSDRPGDRYNRETDWAEILEAIGYRHVATVGDSLRWRCPNARSGWQATTGGGGYDVFYSFCTASGTPFEQGTSYTKFRAYSLHQHAGDDSAAARAINEKDAPRPKDTSTGASPAEDEEPKRPSQADRIVRLVLQMDGVELFHDQHHDAFVRFPVDGHLETWSLRSKAFRSWLAAAFYDREEKAAGGEALAAALTVLDGHARYKGQEHTLSVRVARSDAAIWIDLVDPAWRAVRVTAAGWSVVARPPVLFRRYSHQRPQVAPVAGGSLTCVRHFLNLRDRAARRLFLCTLVTYFIPDIPRPGQAVHGPKGSAKTTHGRVLIELIDPSLTPVRATPHSIAELVQMAAHTYVLTLDNMSRISDAISDALCRFVTGEGVSKRELYSDDEDVIYSFQRVLVLNGINLVVEKPDLLDRFILQGMPEIPKTRRQTETAFWADFHAAKPKLFGALLDTLSAAMREEPTVTLTRMPRMADYARWGVAAARALGWADRDFLDALTANSASQNDEALEASPVAQAVLALMVGRQEWAGTTAELLAALTPFAETLRVNVRGKQWPKDGGWLGRRVREVAPNLREAGIEVTDDRGGTVRRLILRHVSGNAVIAVNAVTTPSGDDDGISDDAVTDDTIPDDAVTHDGISDDDDSIVLDAVTAKQESPLRDAAAPGTHDSNDGISRDSETWLPPLHLQCSVCRSWLSIDGTCPRLCADGDPPVYGAA